MKAASDRALPARCSARADAGEYLELELDSLEFEGIDVSDPRRVQAALEAELKRLISERGLSERSSRAAPETSFDGGLLTEADLSDPERLGQAVARHVYAELTR